MSVSNVMTPASTSSTEKVDFSKKNKNKKQNHQKNNPTGRIPRKIRFEKNDISQFLLSYFMVVVVVVVVVVVYNLLFIICCL